MTDLLTATQVTVRFGAVQACNSVDFQLNEHEILGLIGPNGSGKSTLLKAIVGLNRIAGGAIKYRGQPTTGFSVGQIARLGVVRTAQQDMVFPGVTVRRALNTAAQCQPRRAARRAGLAEPEIEDLLALGPVRDRIVGDLPTGLLRKVGVALALAVRPQVLLLDEPAAGLNDAETAELGRVLRSVRDFGISVCIVDHDMRLIMKNCDRVIVLNAGENMTEGTPKQVAADPEVIRLYLGTPDQATAGDAR